MNRRPAFVFLVSVLGVLAGSLLTPGVSARAADAPAASPGPQQVVDSLHTALIKAMKGGHELGFEGRYKLLAPVVDQSFDMPYIAQLSLGTYWSGLSAAQREQFIEVLKRYSASNYAAEFDSYDGGHFQTESEQTMQPGVDSVNSRFTSGTGKEHQFNYLLRKTPGGWRIINVIVDGVSDLSLKRGQYSYVMKTDGFDSLIAKLKESTEKLSHKNG
jgi:phospholipid transport system substrate-binding protein